MEKRIGTIDEFINEAYSQKFGADIDIPEENKKIIEFFSKFIPKANKFVKGAEVKNVATAVDQAEVYLGYKGKKGFAKVIHLVDYDPVTIMIDNYENKDGWKKEISEMVDLFISEYNLKETGKYPGEFSKK